MDQNKDQPQTDHQPQGSDHSPNITRFIEFRVQLQWMLTGLAFAAWGAISMWINVNQLVKTMGEVQSEVKSVNGLITSVAGETAMLKLRLTIAEDSIKRLQATSSAGK